MAGTPNSGKSDPPDSPQRNPLIDGNVSRSSSSNYHNPPSSTPASPPSPSPMDVVHSPPPPSDQTIKTLDRISSLELALCSNFTCCSIRLPDLHALVEHFEEKHVVALNIDGKRIYPENTSGKRLAVFPPLPPSLSNSPSSSRSSSPPTPIIPLATAAFLNSDESLAQQNLTSMASCGVYTPFSGMMISPPDEDPYGLFDTLDTYPIMSCSPPSCNPDFPTHAQTSCSSSSSSPSTMTTSRSHDPMILNSDCHSDVIITDYNHTHFADGEEKKKKRTKKEVITDREVKKVVHRLPKADNMVMNMTAVSAKNAAKAKMRLLSGNNVKKREKAYRCPKAGCTKSYLNPNGLKYHLEKGTCHIQLDSTSTEPEAYTTSSDSSSSIPMHTNASPLQPAPSIEFTSPSTPRSTAPLSSSSSSSSPYFLKIENYIAAMQRHRLTPCGNTTTSMMPTPPATPGSESPNCETYLPLPGITTTTTTVPSPSTMISPSPISLPIPAAPTPISPTSKSMFLATRMTMPTTMMVENYNGGGAGDESQVRPMSP
ncbi:hypothetical protein AGABI2DRAFT_116628 [Agaricus bisporus var. bisporus H97]|uniref:hypothetical protein n=1 Tax=Agaricus bisporus var. bisporus (strain H97 / ATCC MYA-4626 / FGSC 10389) TaxID=936046 RepID=UPI00029F7DEF|nr:hypothetical protein AGABI2DRAFT_116628 [Agaricus bisporus var. bisporus H97]EKV49596.1 hypothetical protein AGABI2DRAFT_116628 [Agaricus bisporus var. bisporus H97]